MDNNELKSKLMQLLEIDEKQRSYSGLRERRLSIAKSLPIGTYIVGDLVIIVRPRQGVGIVQIIKATRI